ncbi:erythrocyte membrane protein 1, PfEMP1, putative [Plasmodium sp. DRC-Itaito]|nr:erythrocyte membrane protein 1, PfEMP1, putative [Plasmodium sp. DRC-Itaito]
MAKSTSSVYEIAKEAQDKAKQEATNRLGGSLDNLKGHPEKGKYKHNNNGAASELSDICQLDKEKHTNDWREKNSGSDPYKGPCTGKGENRFVIGRKWEPHKDVDDKNKEVLFPPRRLDMCTSNLENLARKNGEPQFLTNGANVNDSFTGDVLLSAKYEAQNILLHYGDKNDQSGMCRAVRNSFADLGDIIRGTDMWDKNTDAQKLQGHLTKIFQKTKDEKGNGNYANGENESPPYKTLRDDWWSANRDQVWDAIKCVVKDMFAAKETTSGKGGVTGNASAYCGYNTDIPVDDYIPQKLRWMTEWNENYCKQLRKNYRDVRDECNKCKNTGTCNNKNDYCSMCSGMCEVYSKHVTEWKQQWEKQKTQYTSLYTANNGNDKEFFEQLKSVGKYSDAEDFVDSMRGYMYCKDTSQREYKKDKSSDEAHVFQEKPKGFKDACECKTKGDTKPGSGVLPSAPAPKIPPKSEETTKCEAAFNKNSTSAAPNGTKVELSEWDCVQEGHMCIEKSKRNHDIIKYKDNFETIFEEWLDSFFKEQTKVKETSNECTNLDTSTCSRNNSCDTKCKEKSCNNKCPCYEKWVKKKKVEWNHFKSFYSEFESINPSKWASSLKKKGQNSDEYVKTQKADKLKQAKTGTSNNITIDQILQHESSQVIKCLENCPIVLTCEDKGFNNQWECKDSGNMCEKKEDTEDPSSGSSSPGGRARGKTSSASATSDDFYNLFSEWLHDMEQMLDRSKKLVETECEKHTSGATGSDGNTSGEKQCAQCKDLCDCYGKLKDDIEKQWTKQKEHYNQHKSKAKDDMKDTDLDEFLHAQCITNESLKTENPSVQDEHDVLEKKCNTLKGQKTNYVQALIDKSGEDKAKICGVCEDTTPTARTDECNGITDVSTCMQKDFEGFKDDKGTEKKPWLCKNKQNTSNDVKQDVCVPPRTQPLCIANMYHNTYGLQLSDKEDDLKKKLKKAIKTETKLLWQKFGTNDKDKACRLTYRSFNDFKHMVLGDMLWKPGSISAVQDKIGEIINTPSGGGTGTATMEQRQKWWEQNSDKFWEAVKCGIKEATSGNTGNECPRFISEDDQFEWWAKEWSHDFYEKRYHLVKDMDTACSKDNTGKTTDCEGNTGKMKTGSGCEKKCTEYKNFLTKKRDEWTKNFQKYLTDKENERNNPQTKPQPQLTQTSGRDQKEYMPQNHYLISTCANNSCSGKEFIGILSNNKEYGEYEKICKCDQTKSTEDETENPCSDSYEHFGCSPKKYKDTWDSTYVKNPKDRSKVFAPPRRNSICIGYLFSPLDTSGSKMAAKNMLRDKLMDAARGESHYLYKYYDEKIKSSTTPGNTDPPPGYCDALKRSYYDFGDMVKGTDLWMAGYSPHVEKHIREVFALPDSGKTASPSEDDISRDRQGWWETNKKYVWKAMQCKITGQCDTGGSDYPTLYDSHDQFLRWFIEWGEDFCRHKQEHMTKLHEICIQNKCNTLCGGTTCEACQNECAKYNNWLLTKKNEWNGQRMKYMEEYYKQGSKNRGNYGTNQRPYDYLKDNANGCTDEEFDKLFQKKDDKYKPYQKKCRKCIIQLRKRVVRKNKNKGRTVSAQPEDIFSLCDGKCEVNSTNLYEKYVKKDPDYNKIKDKKNCEGLKSAGNETKSDKKIKWRNKKDTGYDYLGGRGVPEEVYLPPRKQNLCFRGLDGKYDGTSNDVKDEETLFKHLLKLSAIEGYNLGEYYKEKNTKKDDEKYTYDVSPCNAMKYSFLDLRDIILGYDMTEPKDTETEKKIKEIIDKVKTEKGSTDINKERVTWWQQNKDCVWNAMKCGYQKSGDTTLGNCDQPNDSDYPIGKDRPDGMNLQFLRWFAEWAEDFCKKQKKEYDKLQTKCESCTDLKTCKDCDECTKQCKTYQDFINRWKEQYDKQKKQYDTLKGKEPYKNITGVNGSNSAREYLNETLKKSCQNSGTPGASASTDCNCMKGPSTTSQNSGTDMPKSLDEKPDSVKNKCGCTPQSAKPAASSGTHTTPLLNSQAGQGSHTTHSGHGVGKGRSAASQHQPAKPDDVDHGTQRNHQTINHGQGKASIDIDFGTGSSPSATPDATTGAQSNAAVTATPTTVEPPSKPGGNVSPDARVDNSSPSPGGTGSHNADPGTPGQTGGANQVPSVHPDSSPGGQNPGASVQTPGTGDQTPALTGVQSATTKDEFKELEKCPFDNSGGGTTVVNKEKCKNLGVNTGCSKIYGNNVDKWTSQLVRASSKGNKGVLMPPRRRHLCTRDISRFKYKSRDYSKFMNIFLSAVHTEGILLAKIYNKYDDKALQAMKYSFADYGDIVKGTDLVDNSLLVRLRNKLDTLLKNIGSTGQSNGREQWWEKNKTKIWNAMLCGYQKGNNINGTLDNKWCTVPTDSENQFLRWFTEWAQNFCTRRQELYEKLNAECKSANCDSTNGTIDKKCKTACEKYKTFILTKENEYKSLKDHYDDNHKNSNGKEEAHDYLKGKCKDVKCECLFQNFKDVTNWQKPYESITDLTLKDKCECKKSSKTTNTTGTSSNTKDFWENIKTNFFTLADAARTATIDIAKNIIPEVAITGLESGIDVGSHLLGEINKAIKRSVDGAKRKSKEDQSQPLSLDPGGSPSAPSSSSGSTPAQHPGPDHPQNYSTSDILTSTIPPVGTSFALGAIALLFYYMKKKPKITPVDIFRVLDIPQNDYEIPTSQSSNRYIPYSRYKGKTYIYVEDHESDKYLMESDTTDVTTSSSESEHEEVDINDIYPYKSPKYKTLIEVVLKPSKSGITNSGEKPFSDDTPSDIQYSGTIPSDTIPSDTIPSDTIPSDTIPSDIPTNKLTDNEWNQLKEDFISQYLNNIGPDVPLNNDLPNDNIPKDIHPNIIGANIEEKPFITSIQDKFLHSNREEVTYNIDWNVPENINRTTNIMDDPKYNSLYSGIDLINDSLNSDQHIDIYDELMKRKENELFGTKYTKHTTTNSDPISNQIDFFYKWLDRHRDMCEKWNNKEEMLIKLYDEWNKSNNEHVLYIPSNDNTDNINTINHENYNMINANKHERNHKTSLEHLGSTNIPPNDFTTQNNGSQTKNLRTNVSMDIHMDEKYNIPHDKDYLENFYNSFDDDENHYMNLKRIVPR